MNNMGCSLNEKECTKTKMDIGLEMLIGSMKLISIMFFPGGSKILTDLTTGITFF